MMEKTKNLKTAVTSRGVSRFQFKLEFVAGTLLGLLISVIGYDVLAEADKHNLYPSVFVTVGFLWSLGLALHRAILAIMFLIRPESNVLKGISANVSVPKYKLAIHPLLRNVVYSGGAGVVAFFIKVYAFQEKRVAIFTLSAFAFLLAVEAAICFLLLS